MSHQPVSEPDDPAAQQQAARLAPPASRPTTPMRVDPEFRQQHRRWRDRLVRLRDEVDELEGVQRAREAR